MKVGDKIKATWNDGLIAVGIYMQTEQGYVVLLDENKNKIICSPSCVKFEIISGSC